MRRPPRLRYVMIGCGGGVAVCVWNATEATGLWLAVALVWAVGFGIVGLLSWRAAKPTSTSGDFRQPFRRSP